MVTGDGGGGGGVQRRGDGSVPETNVPAVGLIISMDHPTEFFIIGSSLCHYRASSLHSLKTHFLCAVYSLY